MFRILIAVVSVCAVLTAVAAEPDTKAIKESLARTFPNVKLDSLKVRSSPVPGLLEVEVDTDVFYVTCHGRHVLLGDLLDTQSRINLTENRRQGLAAAILKSTSEKNMIVITPTTTRRTITVFTDVDCVYCRRMHIEDVPELTKQGVKVRYLLFPRTPPGSESYKRAVAVWCSSDRLKAVGQAKAGKDIELKTCSNPVDEIALLGQRLGVTGTPAIFLEDGRRLPGYVPAPQLLTMLGLKGHPPTPAAVQR